MARLDRAIGINAAERAMARSGRAMTGLHVNLVGNRSNVLNQKFVGLIPGARERVVGAEPLD